MLSQTDMLHSINVRDASVYTDAKEGRVIFEKVNKWLLEKDISFEAIEIVKPSLEDIFLKLTGAEGR